MQWRFLYMFSRMGIVSAGIVYRYSNIYQFLLNMSIDNVGYNINIGTYYKIEAVLLPSINMKYKI